MLDTYKDIGLRKRMVEELREKGITDPLVLEAMAQVPRHLFVDRTFRAEAYQDKALPIDSGQTISSPYTVAYQSQLLSPKKKLKILEIGTGSGYQAAVLAAMGMKVFTVEREKRLHTAAKAHFADLGLKIRAHLGDGTQGWPLYQPYERILITAASPSIPLPLQQQLEDKGILVAPVGNLKQQIMTRVTRIRAGEMNVEKLQPFQFVPLIGRYGFGE